MAQRYNWEKARIAGFIEYYDLDGNLSQLHRIKVPNRISTNVIQDLEPYDGLDQWNQGYIERPPRYSFTLAVPATSPTARLLRSLLVTGIPFNLKIYDPNEFNDATKTEFQLLAETLQYCRLTSKEVSIVVGDMPMIVFNGLALEYSFNDGENASMGAFSIGSGRLPNIDFFSEWRSEA